MKNIFTHIAFTVAIFFLINAFQGFSQDSLTEDFCITRSEQQLYQLVNNFRIENDLPEIQLSRSLSFVAKTHVKDLYTNHPDTSICNLNSWSDKGRWTPCCHSTYLPRSECILNKARELTSYDAEAHELAYWEMQDANPDSVFAFWKEMDVTRDFLVNKGKWEKYNWQALGVGLHHGYAAIWVGEIKDTEEEPGICGEAIQKILERETPATDGKIFIITEKGDKFYVIYGSYTNLGDAKEQARKYMEKGFPDTKLIKSKEKFRIALSTHNTLEEAKNAKSKLGKEYSGAWILTY